MSKEKFERTEPNINMGMVSDVDYGKTILTAAIIRVIAEAQSVEIKSFVDVDNAQEGIKRGIIILISHVKYEIENIYYANIDYLGHTNYVKNTITGTARMDNAIPVVSESLYGFIPQICNYTLLSSQFGVPYHIVAFLGQAEMVIDKELIKLSIMEVRKLLGKQNFSGDDIPIMASSALKALEEDASNIKLTSGLLLGEAIDNYISK